MSEAGEPKEPAAEAREPDDERDLDPGELDDVDMKDLLRAALRPAPGAQLPELLPAVQKKIRIRSRGKFYGDGWSTARTPRSTYLFTSLLMLVIIALIFVVLVPWGGMALP